MNYLEVNLEYTRTVDHIHTRYLAKFRSDFSINELCATPISYYHYHYTYTYTKHRTGSEQIDSRIAQLAKKLRTRYQQYLVQSITRTHS